MKRIHKGVYGVIVKGDSVLLIRKTRGIYKGLLDLPGGRSEPGESEDETLVREIMEETGVLALKWKLLDRRVFIQGDFEHHGAIYLVEEFDETGLDMELSFEDAGGCEWRKIGEREGVTPFGLYTNHLKNRNYAEEAPRI